MGLLNSIKGWMTGYIQASGLFKKMVVVNNIKVSPVNRVFSDIQKFKEHLVSAEGYGQQRRLLYDDYKNILLDEQVAECIEKRLRAVCRNLTLMVDGEEMDDVRKLTRKTFFKKAVKEALNARFWGHTLLELDWGVDLKGTTAVVDRRHVKPRFGIVAQQPFDLEGIHYREKPFDRNCIEIGEDEDLGRLLQCCIPAILRRMNYSDWAEFAETMGIPTRIGKYNNEETRGVLETALSNLGAAGYIIMPSDAEVEVHNPTNIGQNSGIFEALHKACTASISMALLSNTMTTSEASFGGYAQGKVHEEGEKDVFTDDRDYILAFLNEKLTDYLRRVGFAIPEGAEWHYQQEDNLSKQEQLALGETLVRNKIPVPTWWWYETSGIPMPDGDDVVVDETEEEETEE